MLTGALLFSFSLSLSLDFSVSLYSVAFCCRLCWAPSVHSVHSLWCNLSIRFIEFSFFFSKFHFIWSIIWSILNRHSSSIRNCTIIRSYSTNQLPRILHRSFVINEICTHVHQALLYQSLKTFVLKLRLFRL